MIKYWRGCKDHIVELTDTTTAERTMAANFLCALIELRQNRIDIERLKKTLFESQQAALREGIEVSRLQTEWDNAAALGNKILTEAVRLRAALEHINREMCGEDTEVEDIITYTFEVLAGAQVEPTSAPSAGAVPHTVEDDFQHFMSYSGLRGQNEAALRQAYYAGAGESPEPSGSNWKPVVACKCGWRGEIVKLIKRGDHSVCPECQAIFTSIDL